MATRYGYSPSIWEGARSEMRDILVEVARAGEVISYSALATRMTTIHVLPEWNGLGPMLGEISSEEDSSGRGMLSVLVVHKTGDMRPGPGFFELARTLGHDTSDTDAFWVRELKKVHAQWGQP